LYLRAALRQYRYTGHINLLSRDPTALLLFVLCPSKVARLGHFALSPP